MKKHIYSAPCQSNTRLREVNGAPASSVWRWHWWCCFLCNDASDACECTLSVVSVSQYESCGCILCLSVVDVYQRWCGPCRAVVSLFRKIKNELGDDLLHFATVREEISHKQSFQMSTCLSRCLIITQAEADGIDALEKYRGKCEPTFLFYAVRIRMFLNYTSLWDLF